MKKLLCVLCCLLSLVALTTLWVGASTITYSFDTAANVSSWISSNSAMNYSFDSTNKALLITTTGTDSWFRHNFSNSDALNTQTYKYVHYRFKIVSGGYNTIGGQLFVGTSNTSLSGSTHVDFDFSNTSNWQDYSHDYSNTSYWTGNLTSFRVDPVQQSTFSEVKILVDSISFCSTEAELKALENETKFMNPPPQWTFDSYENVKKHFNNLYEFDNVAENGYWVLKPTAIDPQFKLTLSNSEQFSADNSKYVAFRMKADTQINIGSFFYQTDTLTFGSTRTDFTVHTDGEWHNYIINMSSVSNWTGVVSDLRFDFIDRKSSDVTISGTNENAFLNSKIYVDRIGIFKTEAEANAFLNKSITCNVIFPYDIIINTGAQTPCWDFTNSAYDRSDWVPSGGYWLDEHGLCAFSATTTDGMLTKTFHEGDGFSANEFKFLGVRMKNMSSNRGGVLFFTNELHEAFADPYYGRFNFTKNGANGEWENIVINLQKQHPDDWTGIISSVRIDPSNPTTIGSTIYISRLGFFRSEAEANAYLEAANDVPDYSLPAVFRSDLQRVIVPGGSIQSSSYSRSDYMLSSTTPVGEGDSPVVIYSDNEAHQSVVALSDVNSAGYTRFAARKPGTYTLGYNHNTYTDINGHWAEEYISYVSDREIMSAVTGNNFAPDMPVTRAMFAKALGNMHGLDASLYNGVTAYADVNPTDSCAPYIQWAAANGFIAPINANSFAPEAAITRIDIAAAFSNYIKAYNYNYSYYNDPKTFTDLSTYSDAMIQDINMLQEWGIMDGISSTSFGPTAISTRAEVAQIFHDAVKALTGAALPKTEYTNAQITKKRIRLGVWGFSFSEKTEVDRLKDLGANLIISGSGAANENVWNLCDKYGIEVFMQDFGLYGKSKAKTDAAGNVLKDDKDYTYREYVPCDYKKLTAEYIDHPSFGGHYFTDEPGTFDFEWMGDAIDSYNEYFPSKTAFINLLPMYANPAQLKYGAGASKIDYYDSDHDRYKKYCEEWFNTNNADYICTDIYPLAWDGTKKQTKDEYVEWINVIASVAREHDTEFWCCIQTFSWTESMRTPNEAEFRWQAYSMLSFGATGILLWSYTGHSLEFPSMVDIKTRELQQSYYDCKPVFAELNKISDVYIQYKNLGAFTHNSANVPYLTMSGEYNKDNTLLRDIQCTAPLLFGYFEKETGSGNAFTVVNMTDFEGNANSSTTLRFKLSDMSKTVTSYYRGTPTILAPQNGYYSIVLNCGDGVFVTIS